MKTFKLFATVVCATALASAVSGQGTPPNPPPLPGNGPASALKPHPMRSFVIASKEMPGKRIIFGKAFAMVMVPEDLKPASVTVNLAGKVFNTSSKPFRVEIDTATIPDGAYKATATAQNDSGAQVWTGSADVTIDNSYKPGSAAAAPPRPAFNSSPAPGNAGTPPAMPGSVRPEPAMPRPNAARRHNGPGKTSGELAPLPPALPNGNEPPAPNMGEGQPVPPPPAQPDFPTPPFPDKPEVKPPTGQPSVNVTEVFDSKKYGVKLQYPAGWKIADHSAQLKPKEAGAFWIAFSSPEKASKLTFNFKHKLLKQPTTPENYAKYNPYLQEWAKVSVNGKPAFETTQGVEGSARIVHRKMIIDGKHIWMFNCIDQTGQPSLESKMLLDQLANSMIKR